MGQKVAEAVDGGRDPPGSRRYVIESKHMITSIVHSLIYILRLFWD